MCNNCGCNADPFAFNAEKKNCGCGQDPCVTYGAESFGAESLETFVFNVADVSGQSDDVFTYFIKADDEVEAEEKLHYEVSQDYPDMKFDFILDGSFGAESFGAEDWRTRLNVCDSCGFSDYDDEVVWRIDGMCRNCKSMSGAESFGAEGIIHFDDEFNYRVRCNKCMWEGEEEDLVMFEDEDGFGKGCPKCETDAYLMDVDLDGKSQTSSNWVIIGDIIEITNDMEAVGKKIPLLGRRYEVKEINPSSTGSFPALKATPLHYEYTDKKGKFFPTHPLYKPQADGSTWESSGITHWGRTRKIPPNSYKIVESFGAEEGQFYQLEIKSNMADGWEWVADFTNQQDAINAYYENYDKHPEVQIVEVDSDGDGEVLLKTRNYNLGAESFGAESKKCSFCKTTDVKNFSQGWDDYCMACARRHLKDYYAESVVTDHENCGMGPSYCIECGEDACIDCDTYCDNCEQTIHKNCIEQHGDDCLEAESFGAEYGKRQRFGNRYVGRDTKGKFISNVSVGRSLKADRRSKSKTPARSGFGHKGDSQKGASGGFKLPTDAKSVIGIGAVLGGLWAYLESKA